MSIREPDLQSHLFESSSKKEEKERTKFGVGVGGQARVISRSKPSVPSTQWRDMEQAVQANADKIWRVWRIWRNMESMERAVCTPSYLIWIRDNRQMAPRCTFLTGGVEQPGERGGAHFWSRFIVSLEIEKACPSAIMITSNESRLIKAVEFV